MLKFKSGSLFFIIAALVLSSLFLFSGCGDDKTTAPTDSTPPTVESVNPTNNSDGNSINPTVTVTFSEAIDPSSVNNSSIMVGTVGGAVSVSGSTVSCNLNYPLTSGVTYTVTVSADIEDMAGNPLGTAYTFSFKTASTPVAVAGDDKMVTVGTMTSLDGSQSSEPDSKPLTYTWTQISGPSVGSLSGATPGFMAPDDVSTLSFELVVSNGTIQSTSDEVVVMVMEDADYAIFVSPDGDDLNAGTKESPMLTIQAAADKAHLDGNLGDVYIAAGTYAEDIFLRSNVSLYGGYDPVTWLRDYNTYESLIGVGTNPILGSAVYTLTLDGLSVTAADAIGGSSSIGMAFTECTDITITNNMITAGSGADGINGNNRYKPSKAGDGAVGTGAYFALSCDGRGGGNGGYSPVGVYGGKGGRSGGAGGGARGANGANSTTTILGGAGGDAGAFASNGHAGHAGGSGTDGANGIAGSSYGSVGHAVYYQADGQSGTSGRNGGGGGGGGGGGAGFACSGSGGGGGAGGTGGQGGGGGLGGGASIGILICDGTSAEIHDNIINCANGGNGGSGGTGAPGGDPGLGASGGGGNANGGAGGRGGNGGTAGQGGIGGSGGGGPVIGIIDAYSTVNQTGNTITLGTPGTGGIGSGNDGADGEAIDYKQY